MHRGYSKCRLGAIQPDRGTSLVLCCSMSTKWCGPFACCACMQKCGSPARSAYVLFAYSWDDPSAKTPKFSQVGVWRSGLSRRGGVVPTSPDRTSGRTLGIPSLTTRLDNLPRLTGTLVALRTDGTTTFRSWAQVGRVF
jgi:hypothetical protein